MIATTFGRHYNDQVHSFYSWSPSKFMFEYGWGGRTIDTENWTARDHHPGPEPVGPRALLADARAARRGARAAHLQRRGGYRIPLNVMDGNYKLARDVCPWWDATAPARKTG